MTNVSEYLYAAIYAYYGSHEMGSGELVGPDDDTEHTEYAIVVENRMDLLASLEDIQRYVSKHYGDHVLAALGRTMAREIDGLLEELSN